MFIDELIVKAISELYEQHQIEFPEEAIKKVKFDLINSQMSKEELIEYVERRKNAIITTREQEIAVKSGEKPSNFSEIVNTVEILFSDEVLAQKLSIYGGTIPYLMTGEQPRRMIGDIDTHVSMEEMQEVRQIIANNPDKYKIISDTLQTTGQEYGFEMLVDGVTVSVFPTIKGDSGMIINNFHPNELENSIELVSTTFYGVDEESEIEVINVNGRQVRIMSPEFTYITKGVAGRPKDIEDNKVLEKVIRPEKIEQMRKSMRTPDRKSEVVQLSEKGDVELVSQTDDFMSTLRSGVITTEEMAEKIGTSDDSGVKSKFVESQDKSEI